MKTIRRFWNVGEAGFAQSLLEAAEVPATLADENTATLGPGYAGWGVRLMVDDADVERAPRILDEREGFLPLPDDFEMPPVPPAPPEEPVAPPTVGALTAFIRGGLWALGLLASLAVMTSALGGEVRADAGGVLLVFGLGGVVGMIVRFIYREGRRDEAATRAQK